MTTDSGEATLSPIHSMADESRATTPPLSDAGSTMSHSEPTRDSLLHMMQLIMEEEEVRVRHQATLLELREKALINRTDVRG